MCVCVCVHNIYPLLFFKLFYFPSFYSSFFPPFSSYSFFLSFSTNAN